MADGEYVSADTVRCPDCGETACAPFRFSVGDSEEVTCAKCGAWYYVQVEAAAVSHLCKKIKERKDPQ